MKPVPFWKMSGSGNDFVFVDARQPGADALATTGAIARLCSRTEGVGADGVVFLDGGAGGGFAIRYFNRDGSRGELCGNASLCAANLAVQLGLAERSGFVIQTDIGPIPARVREGLPEIDLRPAQGLRGHAGIALATGEQRIGFVNTGVPHLVVLVDDADEAPLTSRGPELRHHPSLEAGANVNFVSPAGDGWRMRTYERGVEGETLACGTGAAACAILLREWGLDNGPTVELHTTSRRTLRVTLSPVPGSSGGPSLAGEGRLVFSGQLADSWTQ